MNRRQSVRLSILVVILALVRTSTFGQDNPNAMASHVAKKAMTNPSITPEQQARVAKHFGELPLAFEVNQGQTGKSVKFLSRLSNSTLYLTSHEALIDVVKLDGEKNEKGPLSRHDGRKVPEPKISHSTLHLRLDGASEHAEVLGEDELPGKTNYFIGNDPTKWHNNIPTYRKVRYHNVYPGVDVVYYGNQDGRLEHDFIVKAGADPRSIALSFDKNLKAHVDAGGDLASPSQFRTFVRES